MYAFEQHAAKPGPVMGEDGTILPFSPAMVECYEGTGGNSCHIQGLRYLFGEAENQVRLYLNIKNYYIFI